MKKVVNRFLEMMGMMGVASVSPADISPAEPTPTKVKRSKPRFVAGDHFYKLLSMKRVDGKWRCKR